MLRKLMNFEGSFNSKASKEEAWSFLMDLKSVAQCVPGLEKLEIIDSDNFRAKVRAGISFLKGTFDFRVRIFDKIPPRHVRMTAQGKGVASTIDLETRLDLADLGSGGTRMNWSAEAQVGGLASGIAPDLMNRAAQDIVAELFNSLQSKLEQPRQGDSV